MERYQRIQKAKFPKLGAYIQWENQEGQNQKGYIWSKSDQPSSYWVIPDGVKQVSGMKQVRFQRMYGVFFENQSYQIAA